MSVIALFGRKRTRASTFTFFTSLLHRSMEIFLLLCKNSRVIFWKIDVKPVLLSTWQYVCGPGNLRFTKHCVGWREEDSPKKGGPIHYKNFWIGSCGKEKNFHKYLKMFLFCNLSAKFFASWKHDFSTHCKIRLRKVCKSSEKFTFSLWRRYLEIILQAKTKTHFKKLFCKNFKPILPA